MKFKFIEKCPKPLIDTGCTYCQPQLSQPIKQDNLNNTKVSPWKHVLILSHGYNHINDLPSNIYNEPGLAKDLRAKHMASSKPILFSHIFLANHQDQVSPQNELVYIYPDAIRVEFPKSMVSQFYDKYLKAEEEEVYNPFKKPAVYNPFKKEVDQKKTDANSNPNSNALKPSQIDAQISKSQHADAKVQPPIINPTIKQTPITNAIFLACGHTARDQRCGATAPLIIDELSKICKPNERLGYVSHIGGHAYAGNLIIYPENLWYGRVFPQKVQGLYNSYHCHEIVKELYRGQL